VPRLYNDAARYCSIAYGHLVRKAPCDGSEPAAFLRGVSEPQGETLLVEDMRRAQRVVTSLVKTELSDGQYAALCDFTYNVGAGNLQRSTLFKVVNAGEHDRVAYQLARWNKAGGKEYRGLTTRRQREIALYFEGRPIPKAMPGDQDLTPIDIRVGE
jgi:lysozyme